MRSKFIEMMKCRFWKYIEIGAARTVAKVWIYFVDVIVMQWSNPLWTSTESDRSFRVYALKQNQK